VVILSDRGIVLPLKVRQRRPDGSRSRCCSARTVPARARTLIAPLSSRNSRAPERRPGSDHCWRADRSGRVCNASPWPRLESAINLKARIDADKKAGSMPDRPLVEADFTRRRALNLPEAARFDVIAGKARRLGSRRAGRQVQCGSSLRPNTASASPDGCRGQASRTSPRWNRISVSSSLPRGYDEPEILCSSSR
jgi:hypothetical protein